VQIPKNIQDWLQGFSRAVQERDIASAKNLFHDEVVSFGTVCFRAEGLSELADRQWQAVWPHTVNFDFDYPSIVVLADGDHSAVLVNWSSRGLAADGSTFDRRGRATIILQKDTTGWKAIHTHFSLAPAPRNDSVLCNA